MSTSPQSSRRPSQGSEAVVDLTSSPVMSTRSRKRSNAQVTDLDASSTTATAGSRHAKRRRRSNDAATGSQPSSSNDAAPASGGSSGTISAPRLPAEASIEEINLVDDEDPLSTILQRQREQQVKEQTKGSGAEEKESKLNNLTCAICLEPPTDLSATACGHLFCHECLISSLVAGEHSASGEARKSSCPICRKTLQRKKATDVIPLILMTRGVQKGKGKTRQPAVQHKSGVASVA